MVLLKLVLLKPLLKTHKTIQIFERRLKMKALNKVSFLYYRGGEKYKRGTGDVVRDFGGDEWGEGWGKI